MTAAWNAMKSNYPNSTRAINFVKKNLPKNTEYALETIENIVRHGACNDDNYMLYHEVVVFFAKYHKELLKFYSDYAKCFGESVSSVVTGIKDFKSYTEDEILRVYYAKDKTVDGYEIVASTIWYFFVNTICEDIVSVIENEQY